MSHAVDSKTVSEFLSCEAIGELHADGIPGASLPHRPDECTRAIGGDWPEHALQQHLRTGTARRTQRIVIVTQEIVEQPIQERYNS